METIYSDFKDTWLNPTITIIGTDWTAYITDESMTEIWLWWYKYDFSGYDKTKQYLIKTYVDWEVQSNANELDSYSNKSITEVMGIWHMKNWRAKKLNWALIVMRL